MLPLHTVTKFWPFHVVLLGILIAKCQSNGLGELGDECQSNQDCLPAFFCPAENFQDLVGFCTIPLEKLERPSGQLQWAAGAKATSELSIKTDDKQQGPKLFSAESLLSEPNSEYCGFHTTCWTSQMPYAGLQELTLTYEKPVFATAVEVAENQNPGSVVRIIAASSKSKDEVTVFSGPDLTRACPSSLIVKFPKTDFWVDEIHVFIDTQSRHKNVPFLNDFILIDAIGLYGEPEAL